MDELPSFSERQQFVIGVLKRGFTAAKRRRDVEKSSCTILENFVKPGHIARLRK